MIPFFNFRGYTAADPLDRAPAPMQFVLTWAVSGVIGLTLMYLQGYTLNVVTYKNLWVFWIGWANYTFALGSLLALLRKSSSLLFYLMVVASGVSIDIWLQAHFRDQGLEGWWTYPPGSLLYPIPVPLRFVAAWSLAGLIQGLLVLWLTRLLAAVVYPASRAQPQPPGVRAVALRDTRTGLSRPAGPRCLDVGAFLA